jgi:ATP-dependent Clp protease protease subunit
MSDKETKNIECKSMPDFYDIYISGDITEDTLKDLRKDIHEKLDEIEDIVYGQVSILQTIGINKDSVSIKLPCFNIHINTYGGEVYPGFGICNILEDLAKTYEVNIYCSGYIMSMGIPIILSGSKRFAYKNTTFMIHEISGYNFGKLAEIKDNVKELERLNKLVKYIIIAKTKISPKEIKDWYYAKKDVFLSAEEALKYGIIDEII